MALVSDSHKFIFIHVPKTAGTSIRSVLQDYCIEDHELVDTYTGSSWGPDYRTLFESKDVSLETSLQTRARIGQEKFDEYLKFAVVRNPWDREISYFCYELQALLSNGLRQVAEEFFKFDVLQIRSEHNRVLVADAYGKWHVLPVGVFNMFERMTQIIFKEWALGTFDPDKYQISAPALQLGKPFMGSPHGTYAQYLSDEDGKNLVDRIIRYEHISEDFSMLCKYLGLYGPDRSTLRLPILLESKKFWPTVVRLGVSGTQYIRQLFYDAEIDQLLRETYQQDFELLKSYGFSI